MAKRILKPGVYIKDLSNNTTRNIFVDHVKTKYHKLELSDSGKHLAFVVNADSTKAYRKK